jgi:Tfp pilus assembly protein PilO
MKTLSKREQRTLASVIGLGALILWVYASAIVQPLLRGGASLNKQVRDAREQLKLLQASTSNDAALHVQHRELEQRVLELRRLLPGEDELPAVIELVSDMANQSNVKIQTIFPQRPVSEDDGDKKRKGSAGAPAESKEATFYKDVVIQIDALAGFHQLGEFLSRIEQGDKPMRIANLRIQPDGRETRRLRIKLLLQSYFQPSPGRSRADAGLSPFALRSSYETP